MTTTDTRIARRLLQEDAVSLAIGTHLIHFVQTHYLDEFANYLITNAGAKDHLSANELLNIGRVFQRYWLTCQDSLNILSARNGDEDISV
jgi:hypothetical protein